MTENLKTPIITDPVPSVPHGSPEAQLALENY